MLKEMVPVFSAFWIEDVVIFFRVLSIDQLSAKSISVSNVNFAFGSEHVVGLSIGGKLYFDWKVVAAPGIGQTFSDVKLVEDVGGPRKVGRSVPLAYAGYHAGLSPGYVHEMEMTHRQPFH